VWLITTAIAALVATICWRLFKGKYRLGFLSLMLWGATTMILVDFLFNYKGGPFIETTTDGLVQNATLLGILMLVPVVVSWLVMVLVKQQKRG
jgi:hypothetical protein